MRPNPAASHVLECLTWCMGITRPNHAASQFFNVSLGGYNEVQPCGLTCSLMSHLVGIASPTLYRLTRSPDNSMRSDKDRAPKYLFQLDYGCAAGGCCDVSIPGCLAESPGGLQGRVQVADGEMFGRIRHESYQHDLSLISIQYCNK